MTTDRSKKTTAALSRRHFLAATLTAATAAPWLACHGRAKAQPPSEPHSGVAAPTQPLTGLTKTCIRTETNIEGPFFKANAPSRVALAKAQTKGTRLLLSGRVVDTHCRPIANTAMQIWHADHSGAYDNNGFRFRATLSCARNGEFQISTIIPGRYLNGSRYRPAHIHIKLHAPGFAELTTQLYFAGDPYNSGDPWIRPALIMALRSHRRGKAARYEFVLARS